MFRALGVSTAIISLTILAWKGFRFSFGPFLLRVLEELERDYALFFGLIEPLVRGALDLLSVAISVDLQLFPHWKHCFVLLWLFFGAWTRAAYTNADRNSATFILIWGGALVSWGRRCDGYRADRERRYFVVACGGMGLVLVRIYRVSNWSAVRTQSTCWMDELRCVGVHHLPCGFG